jgi:hypothetical protein
MPILEKFGAGLQHIFEPKPAGVGDFIRCWQLMANDRFWPNAAMSVTDPKQTLKNEGSDGSDATRG